MAVFDSNISRFRINDSGDVERDISPYIVGISGIPGARTLLPATTINDTGRKSHPSIQQTDIRLDLLWSDDANVGSWTVFEGLFTQTAARAYAYGPEGDSSGDEKITGTLLVSSIDIGVRVGSLVAITVQAEGQGVVTFTTW